MKNNIGLILYLVSFNVFAEQYCASIDNVPRTTPNVRFEDNNGLISDVYTNLMWTKCSIGLTGINCETGTANTYTWKQGLDYSESIIFNSYNDWRIPNVKELRTIVEVNCISPSINPNYFPNTSSVRYWTSTPDISNPDHAWVVSFHDGSSSRNGSPKDGSRPIRLVRDIN